MTTEEKRTVELLRQNGKSNAEIAEHLHISPNTIKSYLKRKKRSDNSCLMCGITITQTPHRKKKKFCSDQCRQKYWKKNAGRTSTMKEVICAGCGKKFYAYESKQRKYCSLLCYHGGIADEQ